jgi:hypothetical protein
LQRWRQSESLAALRRVSARPGERALPSVE